MTTYIDAVLAVWPIAAVCLVAYVLACLLAAAMDALDRRRAMTQHPSSATRQARTPDWQRLEAELRGER